MDPIQGMEAAMDPSMTMRPWSVCRALAVVSLAVPGAACSEGPATTPPAVERSSGQRRAEKSPTPNLAKQLTWLPSSTTSIARLRPGTMPALEWLGGAMGGRKAECWRRLEPTIEASFWFEGDEGRPRKPDEASDDPVVAYTALQREGLRRRELALQLATERSPSSSDSVATHEAIQGEILEVEKVLAVVMPGPATAYLGFRGSIDRTAVERCVETAFPTGHVLHGRLTRKGDITEIATGLGTTLLWWRGDGWVFAGSEAQIEAVRLADASLAENPCMQRLLDALPDRPVSVARCDRLFDNLLEMPSQGYLIGGSVVPRAEMDLTVTVFYASADAARRARDAWASGSFPSWVPDPVGAFLASRPASVDGTRLVIEVKLTRSDWEKVDVGAIQEMAERMADSRQRAPSR